MIKLYKKGDISISYFIMVVLFLALLVPMMAFSNKFESSMGEKAFSEACNKYLTTNLIGKKLFDDNFKESDKNNPCAREDVTIVSENNYDTMGQMAEKMTACYNSFNRGKSNLFSAETDTRTTFCAICHKIDFEKKDLQIKNYEWNRFLATQKYSITNEIFMNIFASDEYLSSYLEDEAQYTNVIKEDGTHIDLSQEILFDTSKEYITLFVYNKTTLPTKFDRFIQGGAAGMVLGVVVGSVVIVATGGTALPVVGTLFFAGAVGTIGGGTAYAKYHSDSKSSWISSIQVVPYESDSLRKIKCDTVVGLSAQGVETKPY